MKFVWSLLNYQKLGFNFRLILRNQIGMGNDIILKEVRWKICLYLIVKMAKTETLKPSSIIIKYQWNVSFKTHQLFSSQDEPITI